MIYVLFCITHSYQLSSTNKTDHHDITEILLKMVLNTIKLTLTYLSDQLKPLFT